MNAELCKTCRTPLLSGVRYSASDFCLPCATGKPAPVAVSARHPVASPAASRDEESATVARIAALANGTTASSTTPDSGEEVSFIRRMVQIDEEHLRARQVARAAAVES